LRVKHYSIRTEQAYVDWIRRYILFHRKRHPSEMGEREITEFLTHLAVEKHVAASTQNQAFAALLFLYQQVLERKLDFIDNVQRVTRPARLPVVLTPSEARAVLAHLKSEYRLMAELLYGSGLRLMECVRLRVKDIDFGYGHITVRDGKGLRDRITILPERLRRPLQVHLERAQEIHQHDLREGGGRAYLPFALERKYRNANRSWSWQYAFPAAKVSTDPARAKLGAIMFRRKICKKQSKLPSNGRESVRLQVATRCATVSLLTCWKTGMISALCRNCSVTKMCRPR
jgi:integron integrase